MTGAPDTKVLEGRETTLKLAFAVADPKDLVMQVEPDLDHVEALFQK